MDWEAEAKFEVAFLFGKIFNVGGFTKYDLKCRVDTGDKPTYRSIRKRVSAPYDQTVHGTIDKSLFLSSKEKILDYFNNIDINPLRRFGNKFPNTVDENADGDQKHLLHFKTPFLDSFLDVKVINPKSAKGDPPIGSARLHLGVLVLGGPSVKKTLELRDPSGNKIGEVEVDVAVRRVQNPPSREKIVHVVPEIIVPVVAERTVEESDLPDMR